MNVERVAGEIYEHAVAHYNDGGWDVIVEAWGVGELVRCFIDEGLTTDAEAWSLINSLVDIWADRQADAVNSAF